MTFSAVNLHNKLEQIDSSQSTIETLSRYIIFYRMNYEVITDIIIKSLFKSDKSKKIPFLYLLNDILQNERRKSTNFANCFKPKMSQIVEHIALTDQGSTHRVQRTLQIWIDRKIYPQEFIVGLIHSIENPNKSQQGGGTKQKMDHQNSGSSSNEKDSQKKHSHHHQQKFQKEQEQQPQQEEGEELNNEPEEFVYSGQFAIDDLIEDLNEINNLIYDVKGFDKKNNEQNQVMSQIKKGDLEKQVATANQDYMPVCQRLVNVKVEFLEKFRKNLNSELELRAKLGQLIQNLNKKLREELYKKQKIRALCENQLIGLTDLKERISEKINQRKRNYENNTQKNQENEKNRRFNMYKK
ncbi:regulation of nuclear pre-mRNA domain-containing protein 1b [Anaeramoeba flamelloides]|uniref:Regulation of nuclear pre-mRNA domain-containing protein 1b n=1 Tax=Anaeramoeba flamelloides TaxID=1746091 RepID=A0ABQ8YGF8_9EUKA|nr:regulation of nuclear pre-mRNA domain-containing protein 1b [Anaeramoeba flamelloides]